ncbi:COG3014 family protein [Candidatus Sulfurimonas baltica]|uniref:Lipoprotein n=1 Tax=Candidatus Sulfurimonas baltica TaxID=2740404 RepID=A0A7S7LTW7_9BACT|nr:hypothetical protein [Candidatus Sulfurimonas baltica]QOY51308.1 hypothetical protein HUE88_09240 [Candidatus Sulfurimonas baltica]
MKLLKHLLFVTLLPLLFSGCVSNLANSIGVDLSNSSQQDKMYIAGHYAEAATLAYESKDKRASLDEANLLSILKAGNSYFYAKDYINSIKMLDESENIIKFHHEETIGGSVADYMSQLMLNDAAIDYHATISEAIMVNTYKSLDYMALGKYAEARVELNRAIDRQRRAKETYAELIGKQKDAIAEKRREKRSAGFDKTLSNATIKNIAQRNYSSLEQFQAYPDFVNPFTTYLAGLFFAIEGDYSKSSSLLKEVHGMVPKNKTVKADFEMVEDALSGKPISEKYVWVIYENGLGAIKSEYRVNIPMFLFTPKLVYAGIALPKMNTREQATSNITVFSHGEKLEDTSLVADMDRVVLTEFNYSYNDILTRAVFSAILKTYAQYRANEKGGAVLGLATGIFQSLTTHADTRVWNSLPKNFQIARVKMPSDGKLLLKAGVKNLDVKIDINAKHSMIYVKIPAVISTPGISVISFY